MGQSLDPNDRPPRGEYGLIQIVEIAKDVGLVLILIPSF